jgi:hypothetical protein
MVSQKCHLIFYGVEMEDFPTFHKVIFFVISTLSFFFKSKKKYWGPEPAPGLQDGRFGVLYGGKID